MKPRKLVIWQATIKTGGKHEISKKLLDEAEQWLLIFERAGLYSIDNVLAFDWESLQKKGFEIAIKLKQELGDKAVVRYVKPTEDPVDVYYVGVM